MSAEPDTPAETGPATGKPRPARPAPQKVSTWRLVLVITLPTLVLAGIAFHRFVLVPRLDRPQVILIPSEEDRLLRVLREAREAEEIFYDTDQALPLRREANLRAMERYRAAQDILQRLLLEHSTQDPESPDHRIPDAGYEYLEERLVDVQDRIYGLVEGSFLPE